MRASAQRGNRSHDTCRTARTRLRGIGVLRKQSRTEFPSTATRGLHLALAQLSGAVLAPLAELMQLDADVLTILRSCLMKPEHLQGIGTISENLGSAADAPA